MLNRTRVDSNFLVQIAYPQFCLVKLFFLLFTSQWGRIGQPVKDLTYLFDGLLRLDSIPILIRQVLTQNHYFRVSFI